VVSIDNLFKDKSPTPLWKDFQWI